MTDAPWSDADSLAVAIEAAPDSIDLHDAYMAEARVVLGEEEANRLGWPSVGFVLGVMEAELVQRGETMPYPTTYELVALATAKRLLARYRGQLFDAKAMDEAASAEDFRRDLDPSAIQFSWAILAARAVVGLEPVPCRLPDYALRQPETLLRPRFP